MEYQEEYHKMIGTAIHYFQPISGGIFVKMFQRPFWRKKGAGLLCIANNSGAEISCNMLW
ncbi:hypothetical protein [uncultured Oscillibacter sp.]|uniref:hypothetical protein n=1 Tax=uncultured Oscillibacter sp. TaxID=876091 RepID=UPI00272C10A9|nr:hypothetical protein [uncultured Oscillibacter sp.]